MGGRNLRRALRLLALEDSTARAAAIDTPVARYRLYTTRCAVMPREFRRRRQPEIGRLQRARIPRAELLGAITGGAGAPALA
jgi:hypothetical protein